MTLLHLALQLWLYTYDRLSTEKLAKNYFDVLERMRESSNCILLAAEGPSGWCYMSGAGLIQAARFDSKPHKHNFSYEIEITLHA